MPSLDGVWWRHLPHGGDPSRHADPPADGRWQRGEVIGALYFAEREETAWAEWYRSLAELGLPPEMGLPRDLWRYDINLDDVVDLSAARALEEHGLQTPRPTRRQWPAFQRVGESLWESGAGGILYESAAHPGNLALCVFAGGVSAAGIRPTPPPQVVDAPPPKPPGWVSAEEGGGAMPR
jgi:RES domain-containing protein